MGKKVAVRPAQAHYKLYVTKSSEWERDMEYL